MSPTDFAPSAWPDTIGWVDEPHSEGIVGPRVRVTGWALSAHRIDAIELRFDACAFRARYGLPRPDVGAVRPGFPDNPYSGFEFDGGISRHPALPGVERRTLTIVAIAGDGSETVLGRRSLVEESAHARWRFAAGRTATPFFVVPGLSGIACGGAFELDSWYSAYVSPTARIGMRVPILYMRTTKGSAADYAFDADFDVGRTLAGRPVADDALSRVLGHARARRLPVLITLNGGIWADASGTCPEWDVNDRLEEDVANCQWNERDDVMPDDHLKHLPGSQHAPELARALTLNVHARAVRETKKRNLQQAARHVAAFARADPDLFIGVSLDPDVYVNPFFDEAQWYDYNPGTLLQFRQWLAGAGPYEGDRAGGVPDLRRYRRADPLPLDAVERIARRTFRRWTDVDPPRRFSRDESNPYWRDPWVREWEVFRRHLVALHYDELAQWAAEAGIPADRIWSAQGLMAPSDDGMPLALSITSPVKNHDSGGVSIEGSKPRDGHLGAIVYGDAATNSIAMENGRSLYATLASIDPGFGIVEFNTADLRHPERHPSYRDAYRALRDLWNAGARFVSPMAWNGSNGTHSASPEYVSFTAWRNTPLEHATLDFLLARSGLPPGSRLWTFGSPAHADDDGWRVDAGSVRAMPGFLELTANREGEVTLESPREVSFARDEIDCVVVGLAEGATIESVDVGYRRRHDARWHPLVRTHCSVFERTAAGVAVRPPAPDGAGDVDQVRLTFALGRCATFTLARVAIVRRG